MRAGAKWGRARCVCGGASKATAPWAGRRVGAPEDQSLSRLSTARATEKTHRAAKAASWARGEASSLASARLGRNLPRSQLSKGAIDGVLSLYSQAEGRRGEDLGSRRGMVSTCVCEDTSLAKGGAGTL